MAWKSLKTEDDEKTRGMWTHLVRHPSPSYLWHKCIFPIWWCTDSEQQSWLWSISICKGQHLYFKEMSPCGELLRSTENQRWARERETFLSIQSAAIIHVECWNTLPADLGCILSWGLSWSQLHFQPVERKWRLAEAASGGKPLRWRWHTGVKR